MTNRYKIAEKVVEITSIYEDVHTYCAAYRTAEAADYAVTICRADIDYERERAHREAIYEGLPVHIFSDAEYEKTAVYRKIADHMIAYDTLLLHGSVVAVDGEAYLFTAKSGTGKSTHTRLWREYFGDRAVMVNDDKPLIHVGETATVYGTPYNGKHRLGTNIAVPLKAICILTRSAQNHIESVTRGQVYALLVQQVYRSPGIAKMQKTLQLVDRLSEQVRLYRLGCNTDVSAAEVSYRGMQA